MLVTSIFSVSRDVFYSSQYKLQILSRKWFVVCKCFEFGLVQILLFGRVKTKLLFLVTFNPLPNNNILDWSKLKEFADNK